MNELITKLAKVGKSLPNFAADKTNTQQRYDYISADQVLTVIGRALADNGVMVMPAVSDEAIEVVNPKPNQTRYDALVSLEMTVTDGDSSIVQQWIGRGSDYMTPDKATYKAITSGHKYYLMKLFNVGIGNEDGEHESEPQKKAPASNGQPVVTESMHRKLHALGTRVYGSDWDSKRADMSAAFEKGSSTQWSAEEVNRVIEGLQKRIAEKQAEEGQGELFAEEQS